MPASNYLKDLVLNALFDNTAFHTLSLTYVSLHTASPGGTGANEVTLGAWPAYVRKSAEAGGGIGAGWSTSSAGAGSDTNSNQMVWPANDGSGSVVVTHFAVWDALTTGNMLTYGTLTNSRTIAVGDVFVVEVAALTNTCT